MMRPLSIAGPFAALFVHYQILADYGEVPAGLM